MLRIVALLRSYYCSHFNALTSLRTHMVAFLSLLPYIIAPFIIEPSIVAFVITPCIVYIFLITKIGIPQNLAINAREYTILLEVRRLSIPIIIVIFRILKSFKQEKSSAKAKN